MNILSSLLIALADAFKSNIVSITSTHTKLFEPGGVFGKDIDFSQQDMDEDEESNEDEGRVHIIEVRMKNAKYPAPFFPENPSACSTMRELFMDDESANVVFDIKGEEQKSKKSSPKIRKTEPSPTRFYAHRHILKVAAPQLEELSRSSSDTSSPIFEIPDISPEIFDGLLKCIYGHETFDDEYAQIKSHASNHTFGLEHVCVI